MKYLIGKEGNRRVVQGGPVSFINFMSLFISFILF
jgi:hypothetical protein